MQLLLFDIDGTLIHTRGAGGAALRTAFTELFAVDDPADVPFSGRTDRGIAQALFAAHGIPDTTANWERLRAEYVRYLAHFLPRRSGQVLPGVSELLTALADHDDAVLGLLTGNVREGARLKLEHFGLFGYFGCGGFGDDHADRDTVAQAALQASRSLLPDREPDEVWVVGDTPLDIRCARAIGARVIAVCTGGHPREELERDAPDVLLDDLSDLASVLALFGL